MNPISALEEELFLEALGLPPADRDRFVRDKCASDPALAERVVALLRGYEENSVYLEKPPSAGSDGHSGTTMIDRPREHAPGDMIDDYRLIERIGEGGCGVVYVAEQQAPVRRQVALKVIKLGMDTREFVARLEAERQALALMDHAHIARVFDAGATFTGRPYFTMELARGLPITRYCDEHQLPTERRLELFVSVCHAIQHAHQKGIIHRDLKPSNILIAVHDGRPMPKVIDFGIAKALHAPLTDKTLSTHLHAFVGTPAYTSPEQMERQELDVDTRTDIYSLGVLLYELLTGCLPFDRTVLERASLTETRRLIREVEPPRPSVRVSSLTDEQRADGAVRRGVEPGKLAALLRSDLDWIVMHCLEKDRTRRYETANALALDIRRYLDHEPVVARPPSRAYQLRKFIRRHRAPVVAGAAVILSLVGGLIAAQVSLAREKAAHARAIAAEQAETASRQRAELKAREARDAAAKSNQVAQFMKELLGSVGPGVALGRDTTLLRGVLEQTIRRLDTELRDQPDVAADLRHTLGSVYYDLGDWEKAQALWQEEIAARRRAPKGDRLALASSLHRVGSILWRTHHLAESESMLQEALSIRREILGPNAFEVSSTLTALAEIMSSPRSVAEREALVNEALAIQRQHPGYDDDAVARTLLARGFILWADLRFEEAEASYREAIALRRRLYGDHHPQVADALADFASVLGTAFVVRGRWPVSRHREALAVLRECLEINRQVRPSHAALVKAFVRFVQASGSGIPTEDDRQLMREVMTTLGKNLPEDSPDLGVAQLAFAFALEHELGRPDEAKVLARDAVLRIRSARDRGRLVHIETAFSMMTFSLTLYYRAHLDYALPMAEELKASTAKFGFDPPFGPSNAETLGQIYFALGRFEDAIPLLEGTARANRNMWRTAERSMVLVDYAYLGDAYRSLGHLTDSRRILEEGLARRFERVVENDPAEGARAAIRSELGYTANAERKFMEAERLLRQALVEYERAKQYGRWELYHPRGRAVIGLGAALAGQSRFAEAEPLVVQGFSELKARQELLLGDRRRPLRQAAEAAIQLYRAWGKPEKVIEWEQTLAGL